METHFHIIPNGFIYYEMYSNTFLIIDRYVDVVLIHIPVHRRVLYGLVSWEHIKKMGKTFVRRKGSTRMCFSKNVRD